MFNLKAIALKLFRAASTQIITSISIIAVAVCLIMTMSLYIWNAKTQMEEEIYALFGEAEMFAGYDPEHDKWVTKQQLDTIANIEGVTSVSPVLITHLNVENALDVYTVGAENDALVKSRYHFEGNIKENEVVISQKIAKLFKKQVGDSIDIENKIYKVKEILTPLPGASDVEMVILAHHTVQNILGLNDEVGMYTLIDIHKNAQPEFITQQLTALDKDLRIDIVNEYDFVKMNFQALSVYIIVLSFFVLIITAVLLMSTFQLVLYKLKEQLMVLRALGATTKQVGKIMQTQLMAILSIGLIIGSGLSLAIIKLWLPNLVEMLQLPAARTDFPIWLVAIVAIILFGVIQLVIQWQVHKSMRLLPLQIATENVESALRLTKIKLYAIGIAIVITLLFFFSAMVESNLNKEALNILIGSLLTCSILLYLMPYLFSLLIKVGLQPVRITLGKEVYLACQQLMPQVRRNMPIVLSIIGLMVILIFGTTLIKTVQEGEEDYIGFLYEAPIAIKNDLSDPTFTHEIVKEIEALPSVDYAYARSNYPMVELFLNGSWDGVNYNAVDIYQLMERGEIASINTEVSNGLIVTTEYAATHGLAVGDDIRLGMWNVDFQSVDELASAKVLGIIEQKNKVSEVYFDWSSEIVMADPFVSVSDIMVETSDIKQTLSELSFLHERWPALSFSDYETFKEENDRAYYQRWSLFVGVLIVLIIATCLGVIQTLLHTIYSKRTDYAIQRLIGLSPNGLMKLILSQVMTFVLYGLAAGIIIGMAFTKLLLLVDSGATVVFDVKMLSTVSLLFVFIILIIFSIQGYWISRKTLANELVE